MQASTKYTLIDCLRHGETVSQGLLCAKATEKLSAKGLQQLQDCTAHGHWDTIISSPHLRCADFAKQLAHRKNIPLEINTNFAEMDFGNWTNQAYAKLWKQHPEALQKLWQQPDDFSAPQGESIAQFKQRITHAWATLLEHHTEKKILLITHAGVIRILLSHCLAIPLATTQSFELHHAHYLRLAHYSDNVYSLIGHGLKS